MQKLKLTNDFVFKKLFRQKGNESILKNLLEVVLKIKIDKIEVKAEVELEKNKIEDKTGVLDIVAVADNNTTIDIEMQMQNQYNMRERSLYYWAGLYYTGLQKAEEYSENKKAITINIVNFDIFKEGPYHEKAEIRRVYKNLKLTDKLEMHFIQLPKFLKEENEKQDPELWNWLTFICNKDEKGVKKAMETNKEIAKANKELEYLTGDEEVQRVAFLREKYEKDYNTNISGAKKEGEKLAKIEIAKEMLKQGIDVKMIEKITKLTMEEIEKISEDI